MEHKAVAYMKEYLTWCPGGRTGSLKVEQIQDLLDYIAELEQERDTWEYEYNVKISEDDGDWWLYSQWWCPSLEETKQFMAKILETEFWGPQDLSVVKRRKVGEVEDV